MSRPRGTSGYLADYGVKFRRVVTVQDAYDFIHWLNERRDVLGFDTETSGLRPGFDKIRLAQFGDLKTGWAIPWERWGGVVTEALNAYQGDIVLHNSKFDARFVTSSDNFVWPWHRTHDTMTMAHLVNPLRSKGLKLMSAALIDPQAVSAQRQLDDGMSENKWTWATVPLDFPPYWIYAAMDPVLTCHNYDVLYPQVKASYSAPYDLEMATTRVIAKMEAKGARIDIPYVEQTTTSLKHWVQSAGVWLRDEYGIPVSSKTGLPSPTALQKFFAEMGIDVPVKLTESGRLSLDKSVLSQVDHIVAKTTLQMRHAEKNVGPYFINFMKLKDEEDRVHPNIWTMGTRTARMSITDPALQTLPRKDPTVRTAFIPSEGNSLITCDYDQIEARLVAHFSSSPGLINAFLSDDDFFCGIAGQIFEHPVSKKDPERQLTKNTVYGKVYGAGVEKMAETAGVTFDQMQMVVQGFDAKFPEVVAMQMEIGRVARQRIISSGEAYVVTPTGRRLASDDGKDYTLMNYLIQSHAAEILKRKIVELDTVIPDMMILPVHDELVFDVPASDARELQLLIEETMQDLTSYKVPITASSDLLTKNWGEKYQ